MSRTSRIVVVGYPQHIIQRGQLTGSERFVEEIVHKIELRVEFRGQENRGKRIYISVPFVLYSVSLAYLQKHYGDFDL